MPRTPSASAPLLALALFAACAHPTSTPRAPMKRSAAPRNPLLGEFDTPMGVPPFDAIRARHFVPALKHGIEAQLVTIRAIAANPARPDFDNTVAALDYSGVELERTARIFHGLFAADTSDALDRAAEIIAPMLAEHRDRILLDPKLFARIEQLHDRRAELSLNPEQRTLLEEYYLDFVHAGARLEEAKKERLKQINKQLASAMLQFSQNVRKEDNGFSLVLDREQDLAGLPPRVVEAAARTARERKLDGKWVFTLHKPSLIPLLQYSSRRDLRRKMFEAYIRRGANGNAHDNRDRIKRIMKLRIEKARMLGADSWAALVLQRRMARTPAAVRGLLDRVWAPALQAARREIKQMQALIERTEPKPFELAAWDWWYYAEKVRQQTYALDDDALRPYFALDNVIDGAFWVANKLYGLEFVKRGDLPTYHPEVMTYEVKERDGRHVGLLYVDYFPRESKRGGAWCGGFRGQMVLDGERVAPIVTNVGNFTRPTDKRPSLLSLDEVRTLFHEFGHALHALLNATRYPGSGGNIKVDFVELPSQIMENWAVEPGVLRRYARHHETGKPMPDELIARLERARHFNQGFTTVEYVAASYLDLAWHERKSVEGVDVEAFDRDEMRRIKLVDEIVPRYLSTNFRHIFSSEFYSAGYYSYLWSQVLDADAFAAFKERGLFDAETAAAFREHVLERGGAEDPAVLYRRFRGADPDVTHLLRRRGLLPPGES